MHLLGTTITTFTAILLLFFTFAIGFFLYPFQAMASVSPRARLLTLFYLSLATLIPGLISCVMTDAFPLIWWGMLVLGYVVSGALPDKVR